MSDPGNVSFDIVFTYVAAKSAYTTIHSAWHTNCKKSKNLSFNALDSTKKEVRISLPSGPKRPECRNKACRHHPGLGKHLAFRPSVYFAAVQDLQRAKIWDSFFQMEGDLNRETDAYCPGDPDRPGDGRTRHGHQRRMAW
jgi:hypothetical protein